MALTPFAPVSLALLVGWDVATVVYLFWIWVKILRRGPDETAHRATTTDPDRRVTDVLLLAASLASLVAVGSVLVGAARLDGAAEVWRVGLGLASVVLSWAMVHTIFTLRYAHLHYKGPRWREQLQRLRAACLRRLRLPGFHHRDDVPGIGHCDHEPGDPACSPAAQPPVLRVRYGHRGDRDQLGGSLSSK